MLGFTFPVSLTSFHSIPSQRWARKSPRLCLVPDSVYEPPATFSRSHYSSTTSQKDSLPKEQVWEGVDMNESLFVVDGMALIFRAYYGLKTTTMTSRVLENTRGVYGFLVSFLVLLEKHVEKGNVAVVFEGGKGFRNDLYGPYKETRKETPNGVREAVPWVKKIIKLLGLAVVEVDGWEGDDVIATLVTVARRSGVQNVVIVSDDKDLLQLLDTGVSVLKVDKSISEGYRRISEETYKEENHGLEPKHVVDFLALTGDKSDNIPGVKGIGPVTARYLIEAFGSIEAVICAVQQGWSDQKVKLMTGMNKISKHVRTAINKDYAMALLSKKLVTVSRTVPLGFSNWSYLKRRRIKREELNASLKSLAINVSRFRKRLDNLSKLGSTLRECDLGTATELSVEEALEQTEQVRLNELHLPRKLPSLYDNKGLAFVRSPVSYHADVTYSELRNVLEASDVTCVGICVAYRRSSASKLSTKKRVRKASKHSGSGDQGTFYDVNDWYFDGLDDKAICGIAISVSEGLSYYVEIPKEKGENSAISNLKTPALLLRRLLEDPKIVKYGRGLKSFTKRLQIHHGITLRGRLYDIDVCNTLVHYGIPPTMSDSIDVELGKGATDFFFPFRAENGSKGEKISFRRYLRDDDGERNVEIDTCARADLWMRMISKYFEKLQARGVMRVLEDGESRLVSVLAAMEMVGVGISKDEVEAVEREVSSRCRQIKDEISQALDRGAINPLSNDQVADILFKNEEEARALGWKGKHTKLGKPSTSVRVLQNFIKFCETKISEGESKQRGRSGRKGGIVTKRAAEDLKRRAQIARLILEFRGTSKILSLYTRGLLSSIDERDGRIHAQFVQLGASTGRLSIAKPNLQNLPVRSQMGSRLRGAIRPMKGFTLLCADYSQIEMRILASMSEDKALISAFNRGADVHSVVAMLIFNLDSPDKVTRAQRRRAKAVSYGIPYGLSSHGLAQNLGISRNEAKRLMESFHEAFPKVQKLTRDLVAKARERGFAETLYGRKLHLPYLQGSRTERLMAERVAINMPIQGTQADMIKLAMVRIHSRLTAAGARSRMILQIHDELVLEVAEDEKDAVHNLVKEEMACSLPLPHGVQVVVQTAFGSSWLDATPH